MISRWYQHFTYWIFIWYSLYILDIVPYNPFIAFIFILAFDAYTLYLKPKTSSNTQILPVHYIRILLVILLHYIPLLKLNYTIEFDSIFIFAFMGLLYFFIYPQWGTFYFEHSYNITINQFLTGRFFNPIIGILFILFAVFIQKNTLKRRDINK